MGIIDTLESGSTYKIINVASGTVMTVSTDGGLSIQGYLDRNLSNQMWYAKGYGGGSYSLKSLYKHDGKDVYLNFKGEKYGDNVPLIGTSDEHRWDITHTSTHGGAEYRIWVHGSHGFGTVVDLANGKHDDGTIIQLYVNNQSSPGNQYWLFQKTQGPIVVVG